MMTDHVSNVLNDSIDEVCDTFECDLVEFESDRDHIHLFVAYPPKVAKLRS